MGLNPNYILASDLQSYFVDKDTGFPLAGGKITFYKDQARTELKPIYTLSGSPPDYTYTELPNPLTLSSVGTIQDDNGNDVVVYYYPYNDDGDVELYYIKVESSGNILQFTRQAWPNFTGGALSSAGGVGNYVINGQFLYNIGQSDNPIAKTSLYIAPSGSEFLYGYAEGIKFEKSNTNVSDQIKFISFNPGDNSVESNPLYYCNYEASSINAGGETYKRIAFGVKDVRSFQGQVITVSVAARSSTFSTISFAVEQFFGTGGSPSSPVELLIGTQQLTANWTKYSFTATIPSIDEKSIGQNGNDIFYFYINLPLNAICNIDLTNIQLELGKSASVYPYLTRDFVAEKTFKPKTGDWKFDLSTNTQFGWVVLNGGTIGSASSPATTRSNTDTYFLYTYLWNNISDSYCPVSGGRGASADADFIANKTIQLPTVPGRAIAIFGSSNQLINIESASQAANVITTTTAVFSAQMVGWTIRFKDGYSVQITAYTSNTQVTVNGAAKTITNQPAILQGAPNTITSISAASQTTTTVTAGSSVFLTSMVGSTIVFSTGQVAKITAYISATQVSVDVSQTVASTSAAIQSSPAPIINAPSISQAANTVTTAVNTFASYMVGWTITFANGYVAKITNYISATQVIVDGSAQTIATTIATIQNLAFDDAALAQTKGSSTQALTAANNGPHSHTFAGNSSALVPVSDPPFGDANNPFSDGDVQYKFVHTTDSSGSGTPFSILQPTIFLNAYMKL